MYEEGRFKVVVVNNPEDFGGQRWTVDTPEDLEFVRQVVAGFGRFDDFNWMDVLALLDRNPALLEINAQIVHKTMKDVDERSE